MAVAKRLLVALSVLAVILSFAFTAAAHSGKTDSDGGHRDHINGGYHYHHGYGAHDHYDMDGDGDDDCPYEYKTQHNNGDTNKQEPSDKGSSSKNNKDVKRYIGALFGSVLVSFIPSSMIFCGITLVFKKQTEKIEERAKREKTEAVIYWTVYVIVTIILSVIIYQA